MRLTSGVAQYWRTKLKNKQSIEFPAKLCDAIADITEDFSFAYLKEAFVATLLELAREHEDNDEESNDDDDEDDPLDKYEFWRAFKAQAKALRDDMGSGTIGSSSQAGGTARAYEAFPLGYEEMIPLLEKMRLQGSSQQHPRKALSSEGAADLNSRFVQDSLPDISSVHSFAPLASNKSVKPSKEAWEWGRSSPEF
jgi:hypothetical protein